MVVETFVSNTFKMGRICTFVMSNSLFTKRHFEWIAEMAINMKLDDMQVQCLVLHLAFTSENFDIDIFLDHMNTYGENLPEPVRNVLHRIMELA